VIAVAGLCLVIDEEHRRVNVALGSVGPTILRATQAEERVAAALASSGSWHDRTAPLSEQSADEFADLVAQAAQPLDDVRGTAAYRRHGCRVLARRAIGWALTERRLPTWL
jgi:CO/xanthine dehydrogenase FAD-binding subunit